MTTPPAAPGRPQAPPETSFAETALKLGGKSEDEARRTGAISILSNATYGVMIAR